MSETLPEPSAVEAVLAEWFLLIEEGQTPDLEALCKGDAQLAAKARGLLDQEPEWMRRQGRLESKPDLDDPDLAFDERLDDFRILRPIASGGSGTVFLAEQERLGRRVALKVVDRSRVGPPQAWQRLRREAAIAASLNHPNIVPVYAIGEEGDKGFIAMRHLAGPALNELALPVSPERAARLALGIAEALDAAHREGIVHRDVKPANIILENEVPYLVDFGLARSKMNATLTSQGSVPGTLPYMAPELLSQASPSLDPRADVYALGATLYELLCGKPPFDASDPVAIMRKILLQEPPKLNLARSDRDLETLVMHALEKEPKRRLQSAELLADELRRFLACEPIKTRPTSAVHRLTRRMRRQPRLATLVIGSLLAVVLFAVLATVSQLSEARTLRTGIDLIEGALLEGRSLQAKNNLEHLLADHGKQGALREVSDRVEAELALDRLFALLEQRPLFLEWAALEQATLDLRATRALELRPARSRPLLAAAEWCLGHPDAAKAQLAELKSANLAPLAAASIAELLSQDDSRPDSQDLPQAEQAEEHVLRSLVLQLRGRPYSEVNDELAQALRLQAFNPRALYARGVALCADGRYARAIELIESLVDPERDNREARRLLVRLLIQTGRFEEARQTLSMLPVETRGVVDAFHDLELCLEMEDFDGFEERLDDYHERFPSPALTDLAEAQFLAHAIGDFDGADALFEGLAQDSPDPALRDLARANQFQMHVQFAIANDLESSEREERFGMLREWGLELWESSTYPRARALVAWKLGLVLVHVGPAGQGFDRLEDAMDGLPGECHVRINYAEHCLSLAQDAPSMIARGQLEAGTDRYLLARASAAVLEAVRAIEAGNSNASDEERALLVSMVLRVTAATSDWSLLREARAILESVPEARALEPMTEEAREAFRVFYGRGRGKGLPGDEE